MPELQHLTYIVLSGLILCSLWLIVALRKARIDTKRLERDLKALQEDSHLLLDSERQGRKVLTDKIDELHHLLDLLPFPVWRRTSQGRLNYCNQFYARSIDKPPGDIVSENHLLWRISGDEEASLKNLLKRHIIIGGERRLFEFHEVTDKDQGTFGYAFDLTDLENASTELDHHILAYREVLENLSAGVTMYGPDRRLKFFNHAYARMFEMNEKWLSSGPTLGEVLDDLHRRHLIPEQSDYASFKKNQLQLISSLLSPLQELDHLPNERTFRRISAPHPMGGVFFLFEDVTNALSLERQYNTQLAVHKATLENLYEGIAVFGSDNRLRLCNPSFGRIWQIPSEKLKPGQHISDLMGLIKPFFEDVEDWDFYKEKLIARVTDRLAKKRRLHRSDGSAVDFAYVPLPDGSHLTSYIDVTDSCRIETILRERNEALETADRLKSEFIGNVSHELRTPLNTIIGFTEILVNQYFGELNPQQMSYAHNVLASSQQLLALVNDILDLATIEGGYLTLKPQQIEIQKLLSNVVSLVRKRAEDKKQHLKLDCPRDIGSIFGDEGRLKQALFNLLSNSIKFTPEQGEIVISAQRKEREIILTVSDTGVGISRKDHRRVFEKFERSTEDHDKYTGAGLGLALVKSLIELHRGKVKIKSKPSSGTSVSCHLPLSA